MLEVTVVEHFDVDRARLWDALADLEAHPEWMTDVRSLRFLTAQRTGAGTRYVIDIRVGPVPVRDQIEVVAWERPHELGITHRVGRVRGEGRFTLADAGGGTRLEWRTRFAIPWWAGGAFAGWFGVPPTRRLLIRNLAALGEWLAARNR